MHMQSAPPIEPLTVGEHAGFAPPCLETEASGMLRRLDTRGEAAMPAVLVDEPEPRPEVIELRTPRLITRQPSFPAGMPVTAGRETACRQPAGGGQNQSNRNRGGMQVWFASSVDNPQAPPQVIESANPHLFILRPFWQFGGNEKVPRPFVFTQPQVPRRRPYRMPNKATRPMPGPYGRDGRGSHDLRRKTHNIGKYCPIRKATNPDKSKRFSFPKVYGKVTKKAIRTDKTARSTAEGRANYEQRLICPTPGCDGCGNRDSRLCSHRSINSCTFAATSDFGRGDRREPTTNATDSSSTPSPANPCADSISYEKCTCVEKEVFMGLAQCNACGRAPRSQRCSYQDCEQADTPTSAVVKYSRTPEPIMPAKFKQVKTHRPTAAQVLFANRREMMNVTPTKDSMWVAPPVAKRELELDADDITVTRIDEFSFSGPATRYCRCQSDKMPVTRSTAGVEAACMNYDLSTSRRDLEPNTYDKTRLPKLVAQSRCVDTTPRCLADDHDKLQSDQRPHLKALRVQSTKIVRYDPYGLIDECANTAECNSRALRRTYQATSDFGKVKRMLKNGESPMLSKQDWQTSKAPKTWPVSNTNLDQGDKSAHHDRCSTTLSTTRTHFGNQENKLQPQKLQSMTSTPARGSGRYKWANTFCPTPGCNSTGSLRPEYQWHIKVKYCPMPITTEEFKTLRAGRELHSGPQTSEYRIIHSSPQPASTPKGVSTSGSPKQVAKPLLIPLTFHLASASDNRLNSCYSTVVMVPVVAAVVAKTMANIPAFKLLEHQSPSTQLALISSTQTPSSPMDSKNSPDLLVIDDTPSEMTLQEPSAANNDYNDVETVVFDWHEALERASPRIASDQNSSVNDMQPRTPDGGPCFYSDRRLMCNLQCDVSDELGPFVDIGTIHNPKLNHIGQNVIIDYDPWLNNQEKGTY